MHVLCRIVVVMVILAGCFTVNGQEESLRFYADKIGLNIGTCIFGRTYSSSGDYRDVLTREFNTIVAENEMKAQSMQPRQGEFSFGTADGMVEFAMEHNMKVRGHTLIWHAQNPSWLSGGDWTREELLEQMEAHITGVVEHFKGKVFEWDVVNEAFSDRPSNGVNPLRGSFWQRTIGDDFLDSAFTYAHRADPDAILFYNDYSTSNVNSKSTSVYNKLKEMIENGVPVSGVGLQSHQMLEEYDEEFIASLKENIERFAALGLQISVTELDIRIDQPSQSGDWEKQGQYYRDYLKTCLDNPACNTFMIWGFTDRHSWIPGVFPGTGEALIFDESYDPKPAYDEMFDLLSHYEADGIQTFHQSRSDAARQMFTIGSSVTRNLFNLRGEKIGSYRLSPGTLLPTGARPAASQTVVVENGRRPMVLMK